MLERARSWARSLTSEAYVLYRAMRDERTPWYAKALAFFVIAHTFSPIDLIPDFIPILGYLDDLLITPVGLWLALRLIPKDVIADARAYTEAHPQDGEKLGRAGMILTLTVWLIVAIAAGFAIFRGRN